MRPTVALIARLILPPLASLAGSISHLIGYLYLRSWPTRNLAYYDHRYDHLMGPANWYWQERGVAAVKVVPPGGSVLDLCCGDGIYSGCYYSSRAGHVDAIDRSREALMLARRRYPRTNVTWILGDVLNDPFPSAPYDVVVLFAAIEHFSVANGARLLAKITAALKPTGTLIGSTPIFSEQGGHNVEHDNEFFSIEYLQAFLNPHFDQVEVWTSPWYGRLDAYFQCTVATRVTEPVLAELIQQLERGRTDALTEFSTAGRD